MSVCVYVCKCICAYIYIVVFIFIFISVHVYLLVCICICVCVGLCLLVHLSILTLQEICRLVSEWLQDARTGLHDKRLGVSKTVPSRSSVKGKEPF